MPVTIGRVTSNVTVTDRKRGVSEEQLEELARIIAERLKRESESGEGNKIPERMSES